VPGPRDGHGSARQLRAADTERFRVLTIWLHTYCHHRAHTGTRRSTSRGSPRGVALLVLSPSASPERVWLYAAELDERLLAPHIPVSTRCGRDSMHISLIPSLARNSGDHHQLRVHPTRARRFVDHLTGASENNRVGDIGNTGRAPKDAPIRQGQRQTGRGPS